MANAHLAPGAAKRSTHAVIGDVHRVTEGGEVVVAGGATERDHRVGCRSCSHRLTAPEGDGFALVVDARVARVPAVAGRMRFSGRRLLLLAWQCLLLISYAVFCLKKNMV